MSLQTDYFLYFAGYWAEIDEPLRACLSDLMTSDVATRRSGWITLFKRSNALELALALDLVIQQHAAARMGDRPEIEREYLRTAAIELLRADPIVGRSRWQGHPIPCASHIVALRTFGKVAGADDADLVSALYAAHPRSTDWESAWVLAATAVLRQTAGEQAKQLIQQLLALSLQDGVADSVRCEAVLAIDVSSDPSVEPVLHEIFRTTAGDVKVEAVAALAVRSAVDDDERRFIRDLLDGAVLSGIVTLRKADLLSAIGT